jgi:formylglycine-generating enzyme required for sulfatase activity/flavodoxin
MPHEWSGITMTALVIAHQLLNRRWYVALFKGRYAAYRRLMTAVDLVLLCCLALTAFCGMSMSEYAVPFLYWERGVSFVRRTHLSVSHWAFVLMGVHLGLHIPALTNKLILNSSQKKLLMAVCASVSGCGLFLFLRNGMPNYLFFRVPFAFLDYEKSAVLVFLENAVMLLFWVFLGSQAARLTLTKKAEKQAAFRIVCIGVAILLGHGLNAAFPGENDFSFEDQGWGTGAEFASDSATADLPYAAETESGVVVQDGFLLIEGGSFLMGSPETENWRINDETQHTVTVSDFYIDPYETTQADYERLMGENPSTFDGDVLPVEGVSWLDALRYANEKSREAGLQPVYAFMEDTVLWDRSADGYRLPTEAEWEYACRAGTSTPFNLEKSLDASEANFYGHYPYEIEENYFNDSVLEARPGQYRQTTVAVGSFSPNAWGLYDCHGNVNEWCWDYYGTYDPEDATDPTGPESGTRHVYRGGGWNDFGKNMRSAYRAAAQADFAGFNIGIRLVRNAAMHTGILTAQEKLPEAMRGGKVLIAYFSWGGNTRGIAREIQRQTGADLFEITLVTPYSSDYNTVLMEAQRDQHHQARPELADNIENIDEYGVILLGYPNWWASIPMPIASFLEEYDFTGKQIIPFCSHGGGRFGQSLTAIAKLEPDAIIGNGLSVHYSGGSRLPDDVTAWLDANGIERK